MMYKKQCGVCAAVTIAVLLMSVSNAHAWKIKDNSGYLEEHEVKDRGYLTVNGEKDVIDARVKTDYLSSPLDGSASLHISLNKNIMKKINAASLEAGDNITIGTASDGKGSKISLAPELKGLGNVTSKSGVFKDVTIGSPAESGGLSVTGDTTLNGDLRTTGIVNMSHTRSNNDIVSFRVRDDHTAMRYVPDGWDPTVQEVKVSAEGVSITGDKVSLTGETSVEGALSVSSLATFKGGADLAGNKMINLGDGAVTADSKDAVNGSQLFALRNELITAGGGSSAEVQKNSTAIEENKKGIATNRQAIEETITKVETTSRRVDGLGQQVARNTEAIGEANARIDRVGARAAALSGLETLSFDPAKPTNLSVAVGSYSGETAVALGLSHYFSSDVLGTVAGTLGGKDGMFRAGLAFRMGKKDEVVAAASKAGGQTAILERLEALERQNAALRAEINELKTQHQ